MPRCCIGCLLLWLRSPPVMLPNMDGRDTLGGAGGCGEVMGEISVGVDASPEDKVSMDG